MRDRKGRGLKGNRWAHRMGEEGENPKEHLRAAAAAGQKAHQRGHRSAGSGDGRWRERPTGEGPKEQGRRAHQREVVEEHQTLRAAEAARQRGIRTVRAQREQGPTGGQRGLHWAQPGDGRWTEHRTGEGLRAQVPKEQVLKGSRSARPTGGEEGYPMEYQTEHPRAGVEERQRASQMGTRSAGPGDARWMARPRGERPKERGLKGSPKEHQTGIRWARQRAAGAEYQTGRRNRMGHQMGVRQRDEAVNPRGMP